MDLLLAKEAPEAINRNRFTLLNLLKSYCHSISESIQTTTSVTHAAQALRHHLKPQVHIHLPHSQCYDQLNMNCSTVAAQMLSEEHWSPHRQDVPAPAHSACMQRKRKKKQAIHTLGTGMTSTWSHYNTRETHTHTHIQK